MGKKKPSSRFDQKNWRQVEGRHVVLEALRAGKKVLKIFVEEHIKFDEKLSEIKAKAVSGSAYLYPAVELTSDSYVHKKRGNTIYNPVFTVVGWTNENGEYEEDTAKLEVDKTEATEEKEAPKRRRRRV